MCFSDKGQADSTGQVSSKLMGRHLSSGYSLARKEGGSRNKNICILANSHQQLFFHHQTPWLQPHSGNELYLGVTLRKMDFKGVLNYKKWGGNTPSSLVLFISCSFMWEDKIKHPICCWDLDLKSGHLCCWDHVVRILSWTKSILLSLSPRKCFIFFSCNHFWF